MKEIQLTQGKVALIDDEDFDYLNQWKWCAVKGRKTYYAKRSIYPAGIHKMQALHRVIMNTPGDMEVDHKDHNGLNCQKHNIRNCTHSQNRANRFPLNGKRYLGVHINRGKYIIAHIRISGKIIHLGTFKTEEDAARAYDKAARKYHGEFANLNLNSNE